MFIEAIEIVKTITIYYNTLGDWNFYRKTYITKLKFSDQIIIPE